MWEAIIFFAVIGVFSFVLIGCRAIVKGCEVLNELIRKGN